MASKLYYIYSTMNSGKSSLLLMEAHSFETRNIDILCMKPTIDNRDGDGIIKSRIGIERECLSVYPTHDLYFIIKYNILPMKPNIKWILVDECQFLKTEQIDQLRRIVDEFNINVKCYGLRTDFQTHLFDGSKRLFELADDIDEVKSSCDCGRKTIFNVRYNQQGEIVTSGEQILIGGEDKYKAMCSKCFFEALEKQNTNF